MPGRERWARRIETARGFGAVWLVTVAALGGLLYPLSVAAWYNNLGDSNGDWVHHLFLRKEAALALAGEGPRVLTVGGSGCLFSVDAEALQRELGQPVINLCSHAGVGLEYMLARARRHARPGDTILLIPEYRVLSVPDPRQQSIEWAYFTTWDRRHYLEHGLPDAYRMLYGIPFADLWKSRAGWASWRNGYEDKLHQIYDVTLMTPNGDLHESLGNRTPLLGRVDLTYLPPAELAVDLLSNFSQWAKNHGVRTAAVYQPAALAPADHWRKKELFALLPAWWKQRGIEPLGTPDDALWPTAGFMDTIQHSGAGVSYASAVAVGRALRQAGEPTEWLLVPPHSPQTQLPLPHRPGAVVRVYFNTDEDDAAIRKFRGAGGRVFAATTQLSAKLRERGWTLTAGTVDSLTPTAVWQANQDQIVAICARPGAPAMPGLGPIATGSAWAGIWKDGQWDLQSGASAAEWKRTLSLPLATGALIDYRFELRAAADACAMGFQRRDRAPDPAAVVRMFVLDPRRGILRKVYNFDSQLRAESGWIGEVTAP